MNNPKNRLKITATIAGAAGLFAALLLVVVSPASAVMDNPHGNAAACSKCHASAASTWWTDQGASLGLCGQCHYPGGNKDAKAHTTTSTYGSLTIPCTACHNPHYQKQSRTWKGPSYLATGAISAVTSTTLTLASATWTVDQWKDMVLVPNVNYPQYNYRIAGNTATTITIVTPPDQIPATIQPGATFAVTYGRLIKEAINGKPVRFFQKSGTNSFADGTAVINGVTTYSVCQVCHTRAGQGAHPADKLTQDCTQCHSHTASSGGFMALCDKCHGNPPTTAPGLGGATGLASYNAPTNTIGTGSSTQGKHQKHAGTGAGNLAYACENCHSGHAMPEDATKTVDLGFDRNGKTGGNYDGQVAVTYRGNIGTIVIPKTGLKQCSNIYCHSNAKGGTPVASFATVIWDPAQAAMNCGSCHSGTATGPNYANGGAGTTTANSHSKHVVTNSFGCQKCHTQTTTDGITIRTDVTPAKHVNANVQDVFFDATNPSGAYTTGTQTCTNLSCHSNGNTNRGATPASTNAVWGATPACAGCHGNQAGKTHPVYASGGQATATANTHVKHVETSSLSCDFCHYTTTTDTTIPPTTIVPAGTHRNALETVSFKSVGGKTGTYTDLTATCATTYCHGAASPIWGGAAIACNGCHNASSVLVGRHSTHYASTTVATDRTAANTSSGTAYLYNCGVCHNAATHAGNPISANQPAQVVFDATIAGGGTYSAGTLQGADAGFNWTNGTCSSTYCHSNGAGGAPNNTTFTWATLAGTFTCESCHNYNAAATNKMASGNHTEHINNAAVIATNYGCQECHNRTTTDGTSITNEANHVNGAKNVSIVKGGAWLSPNCTSAYCHSTGQATPTYVNPPAWGSVTDLTCKGCHGAEAGGIAGEPRYANGSQPAVVENNDNSHPAHVTVAADCARCHTDTVDAAGTAIKAASTLHTNQTRNVNFAAAYDTNGGTNSDNYNAGTKTCSAISCHGAGTPMWGGASLKCSDCHLTATAQADVDNFNFSDGTAAKVSLDEWRYSGHGKTSLNYDVTTNAAANLQAAAGTGDECLYCHDGASFSHGDAGNPFRLRNFADVTFGKNGNCLKCHATTGGTGVDPDGAGTTYANKTAAKKVDKYHFGNQHSASLNLNGGQFCWDCHDPHGDRTAAGGPIAMVHLNPYAASNSVTGAPTTITGTNVLFTNRLTPSDYGKTGAPYNGVCNVCHTYKAADPNKMVHYTATSSDSHNSGTLCTTCHKHSKDSVNDGAAFKGEGTCTGCHAAQVGTAPDQFRDITSGAGDYSVNSRHVFGGTVTNFDCIVCHAEGDTTSAGTVIVTTSQHNDAGKTIAMRNVDVVGNPGASFAAPGTLGTFTNNFWQWPKPSLAPTANDHSNMDMFCLSCHDALGAVGINVKSTNDGLNLANTRALTPFNTSDGLGAAGRVTGSVYSTTYNRTRLTDIKSKVNDSTYYAWHAIGVTGYPKPYTGVNAGWVVGAWVTRTLKNGTALTTARDSATLHCADCHTVDTNAHSGANAFMLIGATVDDTCGLCHNRTTTYGGGATAETNSRFNHKTADSNVWGVPSSFTGDCRNCHGGDPATTGYGGIHGIKFTNQRASGTNSYRFVGGTYMTYKPNSWNTASGVNGTCYFTSKAEPFSSCAHHAAGTSGADPENYARGLPGSY